MYDHRKPLGRWILEIAVSGLCVAVPNITWAISTADIENAITGKDWTCQTSASGDGFEFSMVTKEKYKGNGDVYAVGEITLDLIAEARTINYTIDMQAWWQAADDALNYMVISSDVVNQTDPEFDLTFNMADVFQSGTEDTHRVNSIDNSTLDSISGLGYTRLCDRGSGSTTTTDKPLKGKGKRF